MFLDEPSSKVQTLSQFRKLPLTWVRHRLLSQAQPQNLRLKRMCMTRIRCSHLHKTADDLGQTRILSQAQPQKAVMLLSGVKGQRPWTTSRCSGRWLNPAFRPPRKLAFRTTLVAQKGYLYGNVIFLGSFWDFHLPHYLPRQRSRS